MQKGVKLALKAIIFLVSFLCVPMHCYAYFGKNEDYFLEIAKPANRAEGHYLEFVNEETYTVKTGDTLWEIAETYWGNGAYYRQIVSDNRDVVSEPRLLMPGTELKWKKKLYTGVGIEDYIDDDVFRGDLLLEAEAFEMKEYTAPYTIFASVPYANDLQEADPYVHWEEFQREVKACSSKVCGELVSDISFERYQVTGIGSLCGYSFTFDAGDTEYVVMAYFCYNSTTKSEAFALCDKAYCTEKMLQLAKGKALYAAVRYLDPGVYYVKAHEYVGAEDWKYPQLRNPFTDAMHSLYTGPLVQTENSSEDEIIQWKEPELEKLVREELAALWQLTPEEKQAFMERDMTVSDLNGIEELVLSYYPDDHDATMESLYVQLNGCEENGKWGAEVSVEQSETTGLLGTLEDLKNFRGLKRLEITLHNSSITDLSCIGELVNLRSLCCRIYSVEKQVESVDFLGSLVNLRELYLCGTSGGYMTRFFENITDLSVLRNCPHLAYLGLIMGNVESYDFMGDLPEIYYIRLASDVGCKEVVPEEELLPNACFIEFFDEDVRFECGEGYD
ncbi:MAG: LysM peptidoglycan-binding domain-containing protein [Lachnospiraceae bacterium]|nr:LysM peptidoglycan-binding domain-containing protein [Lachnospiraceae bacterium]